MKRFLLHCFFFFIGMNVFCQEQNNVDFRLQSSGNFITLSKQDYIVIPFEGKSAEELYKMIKDNAIVLCNSAKDVVSENENSSISILPFFPNMVQWSALAIKTNFGAYCKLTFRFKDGKIRIEAPIINDKLKATSSLPNYDHISFRKLVLPKYFNKDGMPKEKYKKKIDHIEITINNTIKNLLGFLAEDTEKKTTNEDW